MKKMTREEFQMISTGKMAAITMARMVEIWGDLTGNTIKRFRNKEDGRKRILSQISEDTRNMNVLKINHDQPIMSDEGWWAANKQVKLRTDAEHCPICEAGNQKQFLDQIKRKGELVNPFAGVFKRPERHLPKLSNEEYAKEKSFVSKCQYAGIKATARQASKFRNGKGFLFLFLKNIKSVNGVPVVYVG